MRLELISVDAIEGLKDLENAISCSEEDYVRIRRDVRDRGLQLPLVVDGECRLLDGYKRFRALKELGVRTAPCLVVSDMDGNEAVEWSLRNRLAGPYLHPVDRARLEARLGISLSMEDPPCKARDIAAYIPERLIDRLKSGRLQERTLLRIVHELKTLEPLTGEGGIRHVKRLLNQAGSPWLQLSTIREFLLEPDVPPEVKRRAMEEGWSLERMSSAAWSGYNRRRRREEEDREARKRSSEQALEEKYGRVPENVPETLRERAVRQLREFVDYWGITREQAEVMEEREIERRIREIFSREMGSHRESLGRRREELEQKVRDLESKITQMARSQAAREQGDASSGSENDAGFVLPRTRLEHRWRELVPKLEKDKAELDGEWGILELKRKLEGLHQEYRERLLMVRRKQAARRIPDPDIRFEMLGLLPENWESMSDAEWNRFQRSLRTLMHPDRTGSGFAHTSAVVNALLDYADMKRSFRKTG